MCKAQSASDPHHSTCLPTALQLPEHSSTGPHLACGAQVLSSAALVSVLATPAKPQALPKVYGYEVVNEYHHDPQAFTQGLEHDRNCQPPNRNGRIICTDILWESTGVCVCACTMGLPGFQAPKLADQLVHGGVPPCCPALEARNL